MRGKKKTQRPLGYFDAHDRATRLGAIYRTPGVGADHGKRLGEQTQQAMDELFVEPAEELEGSELSDAERRAAIERERFRRSQANR
jgi:hypothetical protein